MCDANRVEERDRALGGWGWMHVVYVYDEDLYCKVLSGINQE